MMRRLVVGLLVVLAGSAGAQSPMGCPDSSMTPRLLDYELGRAHAAWTANRQGAIPPSCVLETIARRPVAHSDSAVLQALELTDEALRRSPETPSLLTARIMLLSRAGRFALVGPAVNDLFAVGPSRVNEDIHRLAVAAAFQLSDTAAIMNRLANAAGRYPRSRLFAPEYEIWRQIPRLRLVIDTVHRRLKQEPSLVEAYSILSSVYGNLNRPDSAIAFAKIALRRGVGRPVVGPALESLIGVKLRRAQILASPAAWRETLPVARAIDSALSTPASKYLLALTLSEIVADEARLAAAIHFGIATEAPDGFVSAAIGPDGKTRLRALTCERLKELKQMLATARAHLAAGGERFAPETVPAIRSGINGMTQTLAQLDPRCPS